MQTLLWYRFQTIWKQMKVVLICMGVLAGAVLLFALIGGAAAWEAGSFFFGFSSISDQTNGFPFDGGFTTIWIVGILVGLLLLHGVSLLLTLHKYQTKDF